ncbi:B-cell receptor CD22-like [Scomber scombrus]|uniref:B-cell receptor CD22-like n=1 Tax=Scomber scombrus TaxID=13677 RepID=UPI002DD96D46|nr:B-cell receptor CD22-like [Scomber scombrus]
MSGGGGAWPIWFVHPPSIDLVQGQNGWGVTYTSTKICALKGSTVDINCTYRYPSKINNVDTAVDETPRMKVTFITVEKTFWLTKWSNNEPVDLTTDSDYTGRVQYHCDKNNCTLRITDLRESDSAEYKFRVITNQEGRYSGSPGVFLTVTVDPGLQVQVRTSSSNSHSTRKELTCYSKCQLPGHLSYIWYKNDQPTEETRANFYLNQNNPDDNYSCALSGYESFRSPSVYAPKLPSVSVSPSGEIIEGSSVNLTCSSDANPAAKYTWYKKNVNPDLQPLSKEPQLVFSSIQSSESGEYYCTTENQLGKNTSEYIFIDVKYAPKLPSVSASPSAEIVEGSSVTLTCSSDANPAASYTWYKENEDSPKASGQIFTITDVRPEHSGNYSCEAQNRIGRHNSTLHLTVVKGTGTGITIIAAGGTAAVLLLVIILSVFLWMRKTRASDQSSEAVVRPDDRERTQPAEQDNLLYASVQFSSNQADPLYSNIGSAQLHRHMEEQEVTEYAAVKFDKAGNAPRTRVVQGQNDWGVTYTSTHICALKGSTVDIHCTYRYPSRVNNVDTAVNESFWFTKLSNNEPVDLRTDSEYAGRVQYHCDKNDCTLRFTDLRERDSAEYKFRFITNQTGRRYTGSPGVTLTVTDFQVKVIQSTHYSQYTWAKLKCHSSCHLPDSSSYIWYKNGHESYRGNSNSYSYYFYHTDSFSCAVTGYEDFPSLPVYAPKSTSVSMSTSSGIKEGSSVTLTCSSDANPEANYTWYKSGGREVSLGVRQLVFKSIKSSDSGEYYCTAENGLGRTTSKSTFINVKYAPKLPSVSVSPSAEIMEGSSVNLTCSSDANPAANYTWYRENEDSPKASGHIFTITDVRPEHSGNYSCEAQNRRGRHNSTLHLNVVKGTGKSIAAGVTAAVLLVIIILSVFLWMRKKRASNQSSEAEERPDDRERTQPAEQENVLYASVQFSNNQTDPLYSNIRSAQLHRHMEEQEVNEYAAVNFNRAGNAPRTGGQDTGEDPTALYSTVNKK